MKISELWLREWVNPNIDIKSLTEQMTMIGLEVNSFERLISSNITGVIIGKIVRCYPHPCNDKLQVVKVDIGSDKLLSIVYNSSNCLFNLIVAVATVDSILFGNIKIKAVKIHGELSEGILCRFDELGIITDHKDIIEFPFDAPIGQDASKYLQLNDNIIDVTITPNRSDCLSILGIARDIAAYNKLPFNLPVIKPIDSLIKDILPVQANKIDTSFLYFCRILKNINIKAITPLWMKERLRRIGFQSVNVVVDISNYVLVELGQPVCIFDLDFIKNGILLRYAELNEVLILPDGRQVNLSTDTLVIADRDKVLSIAGIFDKNTLNINSSTNSVLLECAFFDPLTITHGVNCYGLHTDTSYRYERGTDPNISFYAMERITELFVFICGGQPGPIIDIGSKFRLKHVVSIFLRRKKLHSLIGYSIPDEDVENILICLGFKVDCTFDGWQVITPSWRFDIAIEEDLIEEIARLYGYSVIPSIPIYTNLVVNNYQKKIVSLLRVKTLLVDFGYHEVITYSFVNPKIQELIHPDSSVLSLSNPISQEMSVMRLSLWPGLINAAVYNQKRQQSKISLFESGLRFIPDSSVDLGVRQDFMLAGIISGFRFDEHWDKKNKLVDFYDIKGDIEAIFEIIGKLEDIKFLPQKHPALHPGQSAAIYLNNEVIGLIGVIHPEIETKLNLKNRMLVFELLWEKISEYKILKLNDISRFPANRRDISIIISDNIAAADIIDECKKVNKKQLVNVNLFDVYRGKGIAEGFKSLAISLILQDTTRTLKEQEIAAIVTECIAVLKKQFQAQLRD